MKLTYQEWLEQVIPHLKRYSRNYPVAESVYKELTGKSPLREDTQEILKDSYNNNVPPEELIDELM